MKNTKLFFDEINIEEFCKKEKISKEEVEKALFNPPHDVQSLINSIIWVKKDFSKLKGGKYKKESLQRLWISFSSELIEIISEEYLINFLEIYEKITIGETLKELFLTKWRKIIAEKNKKAKKDSKLKIETALETYTLAPIATDERKESLEILREVSKKGINECNGIVELRKLKEIVPRNTPEWNLLIQKLLSYPQK